MSMKVVVGGGTSWVVNMIEWPSPSSSVRVLSPEVRWWVLEPKSRGCWTAEVEA